MPDFQELPNPQGTTQHRGSVNSSRPYLEAVGGSAEAELYCRLQTGDEEALAIIYRKHQAPVYRFALRMTGSEATAEDVVQEVFLGLIRSPGGFDPQRGTLGSYLFGMARNQVFRSLGAWKHLSLDDERDGEGNENEPAAYNLDVLTEMTRREQIELLRQAVLSLPPHYREVVVLCDLDELSYADAAEILGCAIGTVRSRLHRARSLLLERLNRSRCVA